MRAPLLSAPRSLLDVSRTLNLAPAICLDAGSASSYSGGQTWRDVSGNGRSFVLGADANASTDDPTFRGQLGQLTRNEYFEHDGGDFYTIAGGNDAHTNSYHKAGALFTWASWFYWPGSFANGRLVGTKSSVAGSIGVFWGPSGVGTMGFTLSNGSANQTLASSTATVLLNAWNFGAFTMDETGSVYAHYLNGTHEPQSGGYTSPSASDAALAMRLGARGTPDQFLPSGARFAEFLSVPAFMSAPEIDALYHLTRPRFA